MAGEAVKRKQVPVSPEVGQGTGIGALACTTSRRASAPHLGLEPGDTCNSRYHAFAVGLLSVTSLRSRGRNPRPARSGNCPVALMTRCGG